MPHTGVVPLNVLLFYDQSYVRGNVKIRVIVSVATNQESDDAFILRNVAPQSYFVDPRPVQRVYSTYISLNFNRLSNWLLS